VSIAADLPRPVQMLDPVFISMPDGVRLAARIWLPRDADSEPVPAILEYLPYRRRDGTAIRDYLTHPYLASHGYASVRVDIRGTGDSDGLLLDEYLPIEQDDALAVIDWIVAQPWCSGTVGMMGISWGGFNALQVAARRPPALRAIISLCSTDDRYADDVHYMGGALLTDNLRWASTMLGYQTRPPDPAIVGERWRQMWIDRLQAEPLLLRTWLAHQTRDAYWKHGSVCENPDAITAATYLIGGWADAYSNAVPRMLERLTCPRKGLIGPWAHKYPHFATPGPAIGFLQEALRWWDYWLKGHDTFVMDEPIYRVWMEDWVAPATNHAVRPGRWVAEAAWPSPEMEAGTWFFGDRVLARTPVGAARLTIVSPQDVGADAGDWCAYGSGGGLPGDQRRDDALSLCFDTAALEEGIELLGAPVLEATVIADRPNALLVARLCDVAPDGASLRVSYGVLNLTHRIDHERPTPLPRGVELQVRLQLNDCAHHFRAGHRLRLALSNAYWPTVWPSPEPVRLELDAAASRLSLPERAPRREDEALKPFPPPDSAPPLPLTRIRAPQTWRRALRDQQTGVSELKVREDTGQYCIEPLALSYELTSTDCYVIHPDDPSTATAETAFEMRQSRGDWRTRAVTRTRLSATAAEFRVDAWLDAWEGEERIVAREWHVAVPRHQV
jgi:putative CocE/NonD family hydrolase